MPGALHNALSIPWRCQLAVSSLSHRHARLAPETATLLTQSACAKRGRRAQTRQGAAFCAAPWVLSGLFAVTKQGS